MPRRPAKVTQADIARAIRAARQTGAAGVSIVGSEIRIILSGQGENNGEIVDKPAPKLAKMPETVL
jgi:hypothetical protein